MAVPLQTGRCPAAPRRLCLSELRLAGPVHLHGLTGLVLQVHGGFSFVDIVRIILVKLGGFVGHLSVLMALLAVFPPTAYSE